MDSPLATLFFRRLLAHAPSKAAGKIPRSLRSLAPTSTSLRCAGSYSKQKKGASKEDELAWRPKTDILPEDKKEEYLRYPMVTADELRGKTRRPKRQKMLMRDFIEGVYIFAGGGLVPFPNA